MAAIYEKPGVPLRLRLVLLLLSLPVIAAPSCASLRKAEYAVRGYDEPAPGYLAPVRQSGPRTCAAACLSSVLNHWGHHTDEKQIITALGPPPPGGYTLGEMRDYAKHHGFAGFVVSGDIEFLTAQTKLLRPVIVALRQRGANHTVAVSGITPERAVILMDPALGETVLMDAETFTGQWSRLGNPALIIAPGP